MLEKSEGKRRRERQRMRCLDSNQLNGHEFEQILGDSEGQGSLACLQSIGSQRVRDNLVTK